MCYNIKYMGGVPLDPYSNYSNGEEGRFKTWNYQVRPEWKKNFNMPWGTNFDLK